MEEKTKRSEKIISGDAVGELESFKSLGYFVRQTGSSVVDVRRRIKKWRKAFYVIRGFQ